MSNTIVSVEWLHKNIEDSDLIILDSSSLEEESAHSRSYIKGARVFNLKKDFSDPDSSLPNTLPSPAYFEEGCRKLGINQTNRIVVYDDIGIFQSPRVWWMFLTMGHQEVYVLDGGLPLWINNGFETVSEPTAVKRRGDFKADFNKNLIKNIDSVIRNLTSQNNIVIDARSKGRFDGTSPEPREGLSSGHIQDSLNLPFNTVLVNGIFKTKEELTQIFKSLITSEKPIIFSCGSGLTACIIYLAAEIVLDNPKSVYDGSWTEWVIKDQPIVKKS